jgi:hypothetical protein
MPAKMQAGIAKQNDDVNWFEPFFGANCNAYGLSLSLVFLKDVLVIC